MQAVPITTNVVSSNPDHAMCTRYNIRERPFNLKGGGGGGGYGLFLKKYSDSECC